MACFALRKTGESPQFPSPHILDSYPGLKVSILMLIRLAYDIQFDPPAEIAMVALLNVHPSRVHDLL